MDFSDRQNLYRTYGFSRNSPDVKRPSDLKGLRIFFVPKLLLLFVLLASTFSVGFLFSFKYLSPFGLLRSTLVSLNYGRSISLLISWILSTEGAKRRFFWVKREIVKEKKAHKTSTKHFSSINEIEIMINRKRKTYIPELKL